MLQQILQLIVDFVGTLLAGACLLRAWMQWQRVGVRNALGQFVLTVTDWLVRPLRRVVPGYGGVDWASLIGASLVSLCAVLVLAGASMASGAGSFPNVALLLGVAVMWTIKWAVYLAQALVLIMAILSWVNPFSPLLPVVDALAGPLLRPIRRIVPLIGRVDLSPVIFLLLAQIALIVLRRLALETLGVF